MLPRMPSKRYKSRRAPRVKSLRPSVDPVSEATSLKKAVSSLQQIRLNIKMNLERMDETGLLFKAEWNDSQAMMSVMQQINSKIRDLYFNLLEFHAKTIQRIYRGFVARISVQFYRSTITSANIVKGCIIRRAYFKRKTARLNERRRASMKLVGGFRKWSEARIEIKRQKSIRLQSWWRSRVAKRHVEVLRRAKRMRHQIRRVFLDVSRLIFGVRAFQFCLQQGIERDAIERLRVREEVAEKEKLKVEIVQELIEEKPRRRVEVKKRRFIKGRNAVTSQKLESEDEELYQDDFEDE